jgi:hypothetical protein
MVMGDPVAAALADSVAIPTVPAKLRTVAKAIVSAIRVTGNLMVVPPPGPSGEPGPQPLPVPNPILTSM